MYKEKTRNTVPRKRMNGCVCLDGATCVFCFFVSVMIYFRKRTHTRNVLTLFPLCENIHNKWQQLAVGFVFLKKADAPRVIEHTQLMDDVLTIFR